MNVLEQEECAVAGSYRNHVSDEEIERSFAALCGGQATDSVLVVKTLNRQEVEKGARVSAFAKSPRKAFSLRRRSPFVSVDTSPQLRSICRVTGKRAVLVKFCEQK